MERKGLLGLGGAALVAVGIWACLPPAGPPQSPPTTTGARADAGSLAASCPHRRYIAFNPAWRATACPATVQGSGGYWAGSVLFSSEESSGSPSPPAPGSPAWAALPPKLREYCAYTWTAGGAGEDVGALASVVGPPRSAPVGASASAGPPKQTTLGPDCEIVSPVDSFTVTGCNDDGPAAVACAALWAGAERAVDALPAPGGVPTRKTTAPGSVQVLVVDTSPTGRFDAPGPRSQHGRAVGAIIRELACMGSSSCAASVTSQIGMPEVSLVPSTAGYRTGGSFGSPSEVAVAIWKGSPVAAKPVPFVINLSLGWVHRDGPAASLDATESAARDALRYATCHGALVLAAAGNLSTIGSTESGPLAPAAWEAQPGPLPAECNEDFGFHLFVTPPSLDRSPPPSPPAAPLLYAVGGVDAHDQPLPNARPGARPRLAAYGAVVTVPEAAGAPPSTPVMTGSSIATAVASGIAAATWAAMPRSATAAAVMETMYHSAIPLSAVADFPARDAGVQRLSLCEAVTAACGTACGALPPCRPVAARAGQVEIPTRWAGLAPTESVPCRGAACGLPRGNAIDSPWAFPQPNGTGCDSCVGSSESLQSQAAPAGVASSQAPTIEVRGVLAAPAERFVLSLTMPDGGAAEYEISLPTPSTTFSAGPFPRPARALLATMTDGGATIDPIVLVP